MNSRDLTKLYREVHNTMRNIDGLQPQEAFDELLKYLFFKQEFEDNITDNIVLNSKKIKQYFKIFLQNKNSWSSMLWKDKTIHLSDSCLLKVHNILQTINFNQLDYDIRSQAIKEFLTPEIRKGLGIFLTPDTIISTIIEYSSPKSNAIVFDPSCGTGTFLIEYLKYVKDYSSSKTIIGFDKNPRMLLLAELNLGHIQNVIFQKKLTDTLKDNDFTKADYIFTNPPFGISIDSKDYNFNSFETCKDKDGYPLKKQTSEIVFIEKNLNMLNDNGLLAIIIPKSIATNNSLQNARESLGKIAYIESIISLPSETFATTGTQSTTIILFLRKYTNKNANHTISIPIATITNVGFDSTGRQIEGSQLPSCATLLQKAKQNQTSLDFVSISHTLKIKDTFKELSNLFIKQSNKQDCIQLSELCEVITTGKTPARKDYTENGYFIIKVGNLTGNGINWDARDRNFVNKTEIEKRKQSKKTLILQEGDILLTSSAHNPKYIAKKSDIYIHKPGFINELISFSGEVMLIRPNKHKINPYTLLAFFRHSETILHIQSMIRGQTAHLHSKDLLNLYVPNIIFKKNNLFECAGKIIKQQSDFMFKIDELKNEYQNILKEKIE